MWCVMMDGINNTVVKIRDYLGDLKIQWDQLPEAKKRGTKKALFAAVAVAAVIAVAAGIYNTWKALAEIEEELGSSRGAAGVLLGNVILAAVGLAALVVILLLLRRANSKTALQLQILRRKNAAMEELNQNMLALSHHQRLETIGTMTASIAHDFNNLLTPIMGYSMMSMEMVGDDQKDLQDNLAEIYNASVKAKDLVTRLADMSRKGKEEDFRELDPVEIIRSSLKVTLPAKPKNVEVRGRFSNKRPKIKGDNTQLSQMVVNLVLNSYDAMRGRGGTLLVSTRVDGGRINMIFKDTGCGMDAETLARIFDPFYTTKESGKGTGLGLAIVAQIAETHGGKVYVDSTPGEGTEFRISFPVVEEEIKQGVSAKTMAKTKVISSEEIRRQLREQARQKSIEERRERIRKDEKLL